ncbi:MAG: PIG-L deacetylase family protein [Carbonactinosporaceae bacterium]
MSTDWSGHRILILAPHPDDEILGCGGLISRVKNGCGEVYVQFMTVGDAADFSDAGASTGTERLREIDQVASFLRLDRHHVAFPGPEHHLRLDAVPRLELLTVLERTSPLSITALRPTAVALPEITSYHQDHQVTAQAGMAALRPGEDGVKHQPAAVLAYEEVADGWSPDAVPPPNLFVELGEDELDTKIKALALYTSQWREHPSPRSEPALRGLAAVRGAQSGTELAEAFRCLRWRV